MKFRLRFTESGSYSGLPGVTYLAVASMKRAVIQREQDNEVLLHRIRASSTSPAYLSTDTRGVMG